jgi:hypothetical protein
LRTISYGINSAAELLMLKIDFRLRRKSGNLRARWWLSIPESDPKQAWAAHRLGRNVCQPYRVLADQVAGHKAERWSRASEERLAAAKHDGVEVESILINKTKVG